MVVLTGLLFTGLVFKRCSFNLCLQMGGLYMRGFQRGGLSRSGLSKNGIWRDGVWKGGLYSGGLQRCGNLNRLPKQVEQYFGRVPVSFIRIVLKQRERECMTYFAHTLYLKIINLELPWGPDLLLSRVRSAIEWFQKRCWKYSLYKGVAKTASGNLVSRFERQTARKKSIQKHWFLDSECRTLSQEPSNNWIVVF